MTLFHQDIQINTAEKQKFFIQFYCKLRQQNKKKTHYKTAKQIKKTWTKISKFMSYFMKQYSQMSQSSKTRKQFWNWTDIWSWLNFNEESLQVLRLLNLLCFSTYRSDSYSPVFCALNCFWKFHFINKWKGTLFLKMVLKSQPCMTQQDIRQDTLFQGIIIWNFFYDP